MQVTGQATILKNDKGIYKISVVNKETNDNGEEKSIFMQINVGFRRGVELKNKTKINVTDGFLTFFRIKTDELNENGEPIYRKFPKIFILDFEVLEDGIDEVYQTKDYKTLQNDSNANHDVFFGDDDDLPF